MRSQMPITFAQMRTQDVRWEASEPQQSSWHTAFQLLKSGLNVQGVLCDRGSTGVAYATTLLHGCILFAGLHCLVASALTP